MTLHPQNEHPTAWVILNELDRFHLANDAVDRVLSMNSETFNFKKFIHEKLFEYKKIFMNTEKIYQRFVIGRGKYNDKKTKFTSTCFCK